MTPLEHRKTDLCIPTKTLFKLVGAALLIGLSVELAPLLGPILIALILAISVEPILKRSGQKFPYRWARAATIGLISISVLVFMILIGAEVLPPLIDQISIVASHAPMYLQKHVEQFTYGPRIYAQLESHFKTSAPTWFPSILNAGQMALEGFSTIVLIYILFLYLMVDGPRAFEWLIAFFKPESQLKIQDTSREVSRIVSAYIFGQLITSALAGIYVYVALRCLGVPAALMLAVLAAIFDALPVLGFFLSLIPAVIFAATVSSHVAWIVVLLYVLYHGLESYFISPYVYGSRMRMSGLVVLLAFLAGGIVGGLTGALVILPIVASYPIVEKIWLQKYVGASALRDHADET